MQRLDATLAANFAIFVATISKKQLKRCNVERGDIVETGNIQYINKEKGFGFITPSGKDASVKGNNVFFHLSKVVDSEFKELEVDDMVNY